MGRNITTGVLFLVLCASMHVVHSIRPSATTKRVRIPQDPPKLDPKLRVPLSPLGEQYHAAVHVVNGNVIQYNEFRTRSELESFAASTTNVTATASYLAYMETQGWGQLHVNATSNPFVADGDKVYASGLLEGKLTQSRIWQQYTNVFANWGYLDNGVDAKVAQFVQDQMDAVTTNAASLNATADYKNQLALVMKQFQGLVDGYNKVAPAGQNISSLNMFILNAAGDMEDVRPGVKYVNTTMDAYPMREPAFPGDEHFTDCSALIKLIPEEPFVVVGQTTWRSYAPGFLRIYKFYHIPLSTYPVGTVESVAFASSPGFLSSKDDFYVTSAGIVSLETTNSVFNTQLYTRLSPKTTVFCWIRSILANRLGVNAKLWVDTFGMLNSGTYNNQWMAVDMNQAETAAGGAMPPNTLWILEQIPGYVETGDVTSILNSQSYWGSYNIPYFPTIFAEMGYPEQVAKNGNASSYEYCPRANIFRRDHGKAVDLASFQALLRYCDWENDPLSLGSPTNCISSRYDLVTPAQPGDKVAAAFGSIDGKVTTLADTFKLVSYAQSGPTTYGQPPFQWSTSPFNNQSHVGQPDLYNFTWIEMVPQNV